VQQNLRFELIGYNCQSEESVCAGIPGHGGDRSIIGGTFMQWQTPKLVEIACGCEINAYFPADL
jgi:coenzyme PQQ precursor peptide PqqA